METKSTVIDTVEFRAFDLDVKRDELPTFPEKFEEFSGTMQPTYSGFSPDECVSALQKAIRRGWFRDSFQNGLELYRSGPLLRTNVWNRLIIIGFEDIGLADPFAIVDIYHLFKKRNTSEEELSLLTAIFRACQAKKSRINDNSVYMYPQDGIFKTSKKEEETKVQRLVLASENRKKVEEYKDFGCSDCLRCKYKMYHLRPESKKSDAINFLKDTLKLSPEHTNEIMKRSSNAKYCDDCKKVVLSWEDDLIKALENKVLGFAHYYRQAIADHEENIKIGKGRAVNPQTLIWNAFQKVMPDSDYLKLIKEIAMLPNHKWKNAAYMYQTHCINLICLGLVPTNEELKNHKYLEPIKELQIYLDEHKDRKNMKGICDYALDKHTRKGRSSGRLFVHFFEEGAKLYNEDERFAKLSAKFFSDLKKNMQEIGTWK